MRKRRPRLVSPDQVRITLTVAEMRALAPGFEYGQVMLNGFPLGAEMRIDGPF